MNEHTRQIKKLNVEASANPLPISRQLPPPSLRATAPLTSMGTGKF